MKKVSLLDFTSALFLLSIFSTTSLYAVPSFMRQTGLYCTACHTVFPELTATGRDFKLRGYTMGGGETIMPLPLAAMVMADMTSVSKSKNPDGTAAVVNENGQDRNGELMIPQISIFYGGKIYGKVGAFIQVTYDGTLLPQDKAVAPYVAMDNVDIRYADSVMLGEKELVYGVTVNNSPSAQDLWNSTSTWGFPYAASSVAPAPTAATLIDGGLGQVVAGASAYVMYNDLIYAEAGIYQTVPTGGIQGAFGWNNGGSDPVVYGDAPYGRIALQDHLGDHYAMVGGYAMTTRIRQEGTSKLDTYHDWAVDAEYQYDHDKHNVTAAATRIWEKADLDASHDHAVAAADNATDSLTTTKIKASYRYDHKYGVSLGYVSTFGTADAAKYDGIISPDSSYGIAEVDYLPVQYVKFTLQYIAYDKFDGAKRNYDGAGRDASDNNTLYLVGWFMF